MKFQHLSIGQQFLYQGGVYIKDGPVMAEHLESGKKSLIPRSAELEPISGEVSTVAPLPESMIASSALVQAFNAYEHELIQAIRPLLAGDNHTSLHEILQQARARLLRGLGI